MAISKEDFIGLIRKEFNDGISVSTAESMVTVVVSAIVEALKQSGKIKLYKFGSFTGEIRPARNGRNPHTGAAIKIPARVVVKFKPSPVLKDSLEPSLKKLKDKPVSKVTTKTAAKAEPKTVSKKSAPAKKKK